jgi:transposase InsO family protein
MIVASNSPINLVMTKKPEELLHMDIVGPSRVWSVGGKWFVLVIIDDYSRYLWQYCLGHMSIDLLCCLSGLSLT